jgi:hypothetical protein
MGKFPCAFVALNLLESISTAIFKVARPTRSAVHSIVTREYKILQKFGILLVLSIDTSSRFSLTLETIISLQQGRTSGFPSFLPSLRALTSMVVLSTGIH